MSKTISSIEELENLIRQDIMKAMNQSKNEVERKLQENVADYYSVGKPNFYKRTKTLLTSPKTTPVSDSGKEFEFIAYMDESISYSTGTYSGAEVIDVTEKGASGVLGKSGYFKRTEEEIPEIVNKNMLKFFDPT